MMELLTKDELLLKIGNFDPIHYAKTRNYVNGGVSYLSPYLARGVISIPEVIQTLKVKGYSFFEMESFIMELSWREHFQRLWQQYNPLIALRQEQANLHPNSGIPNAILQQKTGIKVLDQAIETLETEGYLHNHLRMYLASLICNHYQTPWLTAATWMHYHLLDADVASNHFSWQWVCGANAIKRYYANQENINKYTQTQQTKTPLSVGYDDIQSVVLDDERLPLPYTFEIAANPSLQINPQLKTCLYTPYQLDPYWHKEEDCNRVLFWDVNFWRAYPVSQKVQNWINQIAAKNIDKLQIYYGTLEELLLLLPNTNTYCKEHPSTQHFPFELESRSWILPDLEQVPISFFPFWKKVQKQLKKNW
jgi:deoxyribodipyrimidine photo-lyase